jgi:hypothetical protein
MGTCTDPRLASVKAVGYKPPTKAELRAKLITFLGKMADIKKITNDQHDLLLEDFDRGAEVVHEMDEEGFEVIKSHFTRRITITAKQLPE